MAVPSVTIAAVATDNIINTLEAASSLVVSGTTAAVEDGQTVTVGLNGQTYTATVASDAWTLTVPQIDVAALVDGTAPLLTADVADLGGTPAVQATQNLTVDETSPSVALSTVATDSIINALEAASSLIVDGTTVGVEDGQTVTVGLNGQSYTTTVTSDAWTLSIPQADVAALADGSTPLLTADVADVAGNPASQAIQSLAVDETASITISTVATDDIINALEAGSSLTVGGTTVGVEDGQTVTVGFDGQNYTATVSSDAWTLSIPQVDVALLADGAIRPLTADVSDVAGNPAQAVRTVTVDETAPIVTISTVTTDNIINALEAASTLTIGGSTVGVEDGQTVTVGLNGQTYTATVASDVWTLNIAQADVAAMVDGSTPLVTADVADLAGNPATQATQTLTVDETAPSLAISAIATDNILDASEAAGGVPISGTTTGAEDNQAVSVRILDLTNAVVDSYATVTNGGAWIVNLTNTQAQALADGAYTVTADVTDLAGNPATEATLSLTVDQTAGITITVVATDDVLNSQEAAASLSVGGTTTGVEDGQTVTVGLNGQTYTTTVAGYAWTLTVPQADVAALADGSTSVLTADVTDLIGNAATPASRTLTVDRSVPPPPGAPDLAAASDSGVSSSDNISNISQQIFTGVGETGAAVTLLDGNTPIGTGTVTGGSWSITTFAALSEGSHVITATQTDAAGNISAVSDALDTYLDLTAPLTPLLALAPASDSGIAGDNITNVAHPTISGTGEEGAGVALFDGDSMIGAGTVAGGVWSISPSAALARGANRITAVITDVAGNASGSSAALNVIVDTAPPAVVAVATSPADGVLDVGASVEVAVRVNESVAVNTNGGVPTLTLNNGGTAIYLGGSGTDLLLFNYTVASGQEVADLAVTAASLNGASVTDGAGNAADFSGILVNPAGTLQIGSSSIEAFDTTSVHAVGAIGRTYSGPVADLQSEYINITSDNLLIAARTPNWFIHSGSGNDAITASSGTNVLDGGTGGNVLTGGSGTDTFFVDNRGTAETWTTIINFHAGDAATVWGVTPADFQFDFEDDQGAPGLTGLTLHATAAGRPTASVTFAGFSKADLTNGHISQSFGTESVSGSTYTYFHANY